jgi:hypothetical protein
MKSPAIVKQERRAESVRRQREKCERCVWAWSNQQFKIRADWEMFHCYRFKTMPVPCEKFEAK